MPLSLTELMDEWRQNLQGQKYFNDTTCFSGAVDDV